MGDWTWTNDNDKHKHNNSDSVHFSMMIKLKESMEFVTIHWLTWLILFLTYQSTDNILNTYESIGDDRH